MAAVTVDAPRVLLLDASALIAFLDSHQAHHEWTVNLLTDHADAAFVASPVNIAEALVHPALHGGLERAREAIAALDLEVPEIGRQEVEKLAILRAETGVKMPDACALLAALASGATMVTRDRRLAAAARKLGVDVIGD